MHHDPYPLTDQIQLPELPELKDGITYLETGDTHGIEAIQTLTIDYLLLNDGHAVWIDAGRHAITSSLHELAPSTRVLERIQIARGFTPYQHTSILQDLPDAAPSDVSLIVVPAVDAQYRGDVRGLNPMAMLVAALADVARLARETRAPVLVSTVRDDDLSAPLHSLATHHLKYEQTDYGPLFNGDEFETLVYPVGDGWVQTTLAFWKQILDARQPLHNTHTLRDPAGVT